MKDGSPFGLAGVWENWKDRLSGEWLRTFAIVTTNANSLVAEIHDRMPVILAPADTATTGIGTNEGAGDAVRQLDREEIAVFRRRGEEFVLVGDITAARLLLQRAAEARDARAALALGAIHDPIVLEKLGVHRVAADTATARIWYEKAREFGSAEALQRLELLADRGPLTHLRDECETIVRSFAGPTLGRAAARRRAKAPL